MKIKIYNLFNSYLIEQSDAGIFWAYPVTEWILEDENTDWKDIEEHNYLCLGKVLIEHDTIILMPQSKYRIEEDVQNYQSLIYESPQWISTKYFLNFSRGIIAPDFYECKTGNLLSPEDKQAQELYKLLTPVAYDIITSASKLHNAEN